MTKAKAAKIQEILALEYPQARCGLNFANPFELLIATILSAQSSDEGVNRVTPLLWKTFPGPAELSRADVRTLEGLFRPLGLFRAKANHVLGTARRIQDLHGGRVPPDLDALSACPGVGRKTSRVVLGECFDQPGIVVDTHMGRVARRLGLTLEEDPRKVETNLDGLITLEQRSLFSRRMILHGRTLCKARKPDCLACPLRSHCAFYRK